MKLVFATNNKNKLAEIQSMLMEGIEILSLSDIECFEEIPETAETLEGNARIKARHIWEKYQMDCFADDTGLEVEALQGRPGVYSARYAGPDANSENNMALLLEELAEHSNRKAQFKTSICLILGGEEYFFEGIAKGEIISEKTGTAGFGYDPIFKALSTNKTFAEMDKISKNAISHRGKAVRSLVNFLNSLDKKES